MSEIVRYLVSQKRKEEDTEALVRSNTDSLTWTKSKLGVKKADLVQENAESQGRGGALEEKLEEDEVKDKGMKIEANEFQSSENDLYIEFNETSLSRSKETKKELFCILFSYCI